MSIRKSLRSFAGFLKGNLITLAGLSIGMMVTVLSLMYIVFQSSYDQFHKKSDRIYLATTLMEVEPGNVVSMSKTHHDLKDYIDIHIPQVEKSCRIYPCNKPITIDQDKFKGHKGLSVDSEFFTLFDFKMLLGDGSVLSEPEKVILSLDLAEMFYGDINCIGKTMIIEDDIFTIGGVIENPPGNTSIVFEYLLPISYTLKALRNHNFVSVETYILTPVVYDDLSVMSEQINGFYEAYNVKGKDQYKVSLSTLCGKTQYNSKTSKNFILFISVSALVLLISIINFINSHAAWSELRTHEIGIRKVMGASKVLLIRNMIINSILMSFIAVSIGLILSELFLKVFQELAGVSAVQYGPGLYWIQVLLVIIATLTGLLAGVFPAIRYSSPDILTLISGRSRIGGGSSNIRKILVLIQYIISAGLLITLFILFFQLRYLSHKDPGYISENRIIIEVSPKLEFNYQSYISELDKIPGILSISGYGSEFGGTVGFGLKLIGEEEGQPAMGYFVEDGFFRTFGMKLLHGKTFEGTSGRDSSNVIIDRSTAKLLGFNNPIGQKVLLSRRESEIIGVVEDADLIALKGEREPFFYTQYYDLCSTLIIHYIGDPSFIAGSVAEELKEFDPETEYNFRILDEAKKILYTKEENQVKIVLFVGIVALILTIIGAYSMANYLAERRKKQVSIRKVMGATVKEVLQISIREVVLMMFIAFLIASPVAYIISEKWLQSFTLKISIGLLPFFLAFIVLTVLILVTVFFKERNAAMTNPVDNLRQD